MTSLDRRTRALSFCLAGLAGYLDALGFLGSGGFFVSFMSGNSTRLGVGVVINLHAARVGFSLISAFVGGASISSLLGRVFPVHRQLVIMSLIAICLAVAAASIHIVSPIGVLALIAFSMGSENVLFEVDGDVSFGLTYMTGALVKVGQRLATAVMGGDRWGWMPFLGLWLSLVIGAAIGAAAYSRYGLEALWPPVCASSVVALAFGRLSFEQARRKSVGDC